MDLAVRLPICSGVSDLRFGVGEGDADRKVLYKQASLKKCLTRNWKYCYCLEATCGLIEGGLASLWTRLVMRPLEAVTQKPLCPAGIWFGGWAEETAESIMI